MIKIDRRNLLMGAAALLLSGGAQSARASGAVRSILENALASGRFCGSEEAAIRGTLSRLDRVKPPTSGRAVVVDIPSQQLAAYENGSIVLESRVVVGDPSWRTPDLDTSISFVRFNPTWTVPESIIKARSWRSKLARNPDYFSRLQFQVELGGRMVEPDEASQSADRVGRFVQRPGPHNALGEVKLGLRAGGAVYLHDTNDPDAFDEDARALSHGCVRVEEAMELAAWVLGISRREANERLEAGDLKDYASLPSPVRVVTTYFTAWPDDQNQVRFYPDVYGVDGRGSSCGAPVSRPPRSSRAAYPSEIEYED